MTSETRPRNLRNIEAVLTQAGISKCQCGASLISLAKKRGATAEPRINVADTTVYCEELKCWACKACNKIINAPKQTYSIALNMMPNIDLLFDVHKKLGTSYRISKWISIVRDLFVQRPTFPRTIGTPGQKTSIEFDMLLQDCAPESTEHADQVQLCVFLDNLYKEHLQHSRRKTRAKSKPKFTLSDDSSSDEEDESGNGGDDDENGESLTITASALNRIEELKRNNFFEFVEKRIGASSLELYVQAEIEKNSHFLPGIVEQVTNERAASQHKIESLRKDIAGAMDPDTAKKLEGHLRFLEKKMFFKKLDGHYNGPSGNAAKKACTRIWRKLRALEDIDKHHRKVHSCGAVLPLDYNEGASLESFSSQLKHLEKLRTFKLHSRLACESKEVSERGCDLDRYFVIYIVGKLISLRYPYYCENDAPALTPSCSKPSQSRSISKKTGTKITNLNDLKNIKDGQVVVPASWPCTKKLFPYFCVCHLQPEDKMQKIYKSTNLHRMGKHVWLPNVYSFNAPDDSTDILLSSKKRKEIHAKERARLIKEKRAQKKREILLKKKQGKKQGKQEEISAAGAAPAEQSCVAPSKVKNNRRKAAPEAAGSSVNVQPDPAAPPKTAKNAKGKVTEQMAAKLLKKKQQPKKKAVPAAASAKKPKRQREATAPLVGKSGKGKSSSVKRV